MKQDMIVILDLGSHENTVVARAIRALGVYSEIYPHDITAEELKSLPNVKGIVINGGPNNVIDGVEIDVNPEILVSVQCGSDREIIKNYERVFNSAGIYNIDYAEVPVLSLLGADAAITETKSFAVIDFGGEQ